MSFIIFKGKNKCYLDADSVLFPLACLEQNVTEPMNNITPCLHCKPCLCQAPGSDTLSFFRNKNLPANV